MATDLSVAVEKKTKQKIAKPKDWKVLLLNDDKTPMDFVVGILTKIFHKGPQDAVQVMMQVHNEGSGLAGIYSYEIAEAKSIETTEIARSNGFPLQVKLEESE